MELSALLKIKYLTKYALLCTTIYTQYKTIHVLRDTDFHNKIAPNWYRQTKLNAPLAFICLIVTHMRALSLFSPKKKPSRVYVPILCAHMLIEHFVPYRVNSAFIF
jgi:hypothetical protein